MNTITAQERERIYQLAEWLQREGYTMNEITGQLQHTEQISKQRARTAAARALRVARRLNK